MQNQLVKIVLLFLLLSCFPARAQEVGNGVICDTEIQVQQFLAFRENDKDDVALAETNAINTPSSCALVYAVYIRGPTSSRIVVHDGIAMITKIAIVGVIEDGKQKPVHPMIQYTIFFIKTEDV